MSCVVWYQSCVPRVNGDGGLGWLWWSGHAHGLCLRGLEPFLLSRALLEGVAGYDGVALAKELVCAGHEACIAGHEVLLWVVVGHVVR